MARLRIFLPPDIKDVWVTTAKGGWHPYTAIKARRNKGWRWAVIPSMPEGAYALFIDIDNPWGSDECLPDTYPERSKIRFFSGKRDEEIRPQHFKGRRRSIWN